MRLSAIGAQGVETNLVHSLVSIWPRINIGIPTSIPTRAGMTQVLIRGNDVTMTGNPGIAGVGMDISTVGQGSGCGARFRWQNTKSTGEAARTNRDQKRMSLSCLSLACPTATCNTFARRRRAAKISSSSPVCVSKGRAFILIIFPSSMLSKRCGQLMNKDSLD